MTVVVRVAPPSNVGAHEPLVTAVAMPVELVATSNVAEGAGVDEQVVSFRIVVTGFRVAEFET